MPKVTSFHPAIPTATEKTYTTDVHCQTCTQPRCSRRTCMILPMCWQHARLILHLQVKDSTIPNAGRGLFAFAATKAARDACVVLWRRGDYIAPLNGRPTSAEQLQASYGDHTAPYAASSSIKKTGHPFIDALGKRYIAHYANTRVGRPRADGCRSSVKAGTNCKLSARSDGLMWLQATKPIRSGDEILTYYGAAYQMEPHARVYTT